MPRIPLAVLAMCILFPTLALAQTSTSPPVSDPQAVALAGQAYLALTGGTPPSDVTLDANETVTAGSTVTSQPVVLKALGTTDSRIDLATGGNLQIRNSSGGVPQGSWTAADGTLNYMAFHNCWTDTAWFFPAFSSLFSTSGNIYLSYIGLESRNGGQVQHIQFRYYAGGQPAYDIALIQHLSTTDVYLDANSLLPVEMDFLGHPDNDAGTDIAIEIQFSNYQAVNGLQIPFHIQRFINNNLNIDLAVSTVALNTGLQDSDFTIP